MSERSSRECGFTLLELIVAAGIMALIAVFSWRGLDTLIREREAIAASQVAIDAYQRSFARLERDALLASDVELDDSGTLRLLAGDASSDGSATTVEYRLVAGALTRSVGGDTAPMVMLDGVATLAMEAWQPVPGGGSWVRAKAASPPPPPTASPAPAAAPAAAGAGGSTRINGPFVPPAAPGAAPVGPAATTRAVAAATGIRVSFERPDGTRVTRSFIVGGA